MSVLILLWWIAVAGVGTLFVAEGVARMAIRRSGYYVWQRFYRRTLRFDPAKFPQLDESVKFETNADGERGGPCPRRKDLYRVLLLGGSTVESALNDQDRSWSGRLQALLNSPEARQKLGAGYVHVGNVGRSGLDVRGVARILDRTLTRYPGLDLVGLMVGPGDLMRWLEDGAPPDRMPAPLRDTSCFYEHPGLPIGNHPRSLALTELARRARMRWLRPVDLHEDAARWMPRARLMRRDAKEFRDETPESRLFLDHFEAGLVEAVQRAKAHGCRVALLRQPSFRKARFLPEEEALFWNGGIGNIYRGDVPTVYFSTRVIYELLDRMDERIERVAVAQGALFIDPQPAITMSVASFVDHFHLTNAASEQVAGAIAEQLDSILT